MSVYKPYYYSALRIKAKINYGFTIVELLITLTISAIVISLITPGFTNIIVNNRQTAILNDFTSYFHYAKSEAVTKGIPVTFCPRNTAGTNCDNSASWDDGWIVLADIDGDGNLDVLKIHQAIDDDFDITSSSTGVTITARGFTSAATFTFCDKRGIKYARAKILSKTGRIKTSTDTDHDGIHNISVSNNLTC